MSDVIIGISIGAAAAVLLWVCVWLNRPLRCPICKSVQKIPAKRRGRYTCEVCGAFWIDANGRKA